MTELAGGPQGAARLRALVPPTLAALERGCRERQGPIPHGAPARVAALVEAALQGEVLPELGVGEEPALQGLTRAVALGAADPADPACAAHLHCPPLAVAVAADLAASALNSSLDSWDQGPSGVALERSVVTALARLVGWPSGSGAMTGGGTESNLMGLLRAREAGRAGTRRPRIVCSEAAHLSVARSAALLGLGEGSVIAVAVDAHQRLRAEALDTALRAIERRDEVALAVVATAGTTDFGSVDPLPAIAEVCRVHGCWLHVDAAYGGGVLFSDRLAPLLDGIDAADSVALDLHKLGWQPVPAGVFLVPGRLRMPGLDRGVDYLNPPDDVAAGYDGLLACSLRTTRRLDALKVAVSLRALGRRGLGRLVERCHRLAGCAARRIEDDPRLELEAQPVLTSVVFRFLPRSGASDHVNGALRRRLLREGRAVVGRTTIPAGGVRLKLTLLNPFATERDLESLLDAVVEAGGEEDR
jgi:L-2,4-diaminobutyrate decarboxylase